MRHQPFWACRCFRSELRRMIRAFAIRTASVLGVCFFEGGSFVSVPAVGIMLNCVGAIELCWNGCTFMGPADVGLRLGITDNALLWFVSTALRKGVPFSDPGSCCYRRIAAGDPATMRISSAGRNHRNALAGPVHLAADVNSVDQHAHAGGRSYGRAAYDSPPCRSARNAGDADRGQRPAHPRLRACNRQGKALALRPGNRTANAASNCGNQ